MKISYIKKTWIVLVIFIIKNTFIHAEEYWSGVQNITHTQAIAHVVLTGNVTFHISKNIIFILEWITGPFEFDDFSTSPYSITIDGGGTLHLTGNDNRYAGRTTVINGCLHVGNGRSGDINRSSGIVLSTPDAVILYEPPAEQLVSRVISGSGHVRYKGRPDQRMFLAADNTYMGVTTIESGRLAIGNNTLTGHIAGNIVVNSGACLEFRSGTNYVFPGEISGEGNVEKYFVCTTVLTGANTYTGETIVRGGTLQVGDGKSGSIDSTSRVEIHSGAILRFEPGADVRIDGEISGAGSMEYSGSDAGQLVISADNTYSGSTTVERGVLTVSAGHAGDMVIKEPGRLQIANDDDSKYSGVISGAGSVAKWGKGRATLDGVNTYSGGTFIHDGVLALGITGTIDSSAIHVGNTGKFDITAGSKTVKSLMSDDSGTEAEALLGSNRLTVDGGGSFAGKFSGSGGGVNKMGDGTLVLNNAGHTANGIFNLSGGTVELAGNWAGSFYQQSGTCLEVTGNVAICGGLSLFGGEIGLNLDEANPSKITVSGPVSASGITMLHVAAGTMNNRTLMEAAFGLDNTASFALNARDFPSATLTANGTQLGISYGTGNDDVNEQQSTPLKAWMHNGTLHVNGLTPDAVWSVYNIAGALVYQTTATATNAEIPLHSHGLFFIQSGKNAIKFLNY